MDVPTPQRILLVRFSHLGDVVHAVPVLHALRSAHPSARIGWAIQAEFAPLVAPLAGIERLFLFDRGGGLGAWWRLRRELREWKPDWTVDAQGNHKSAAAVWCSGAGTRLGLSSRDWQEPFGSRLLTHPAAAARGPHAVDKALALIDRAAPLQRISFDLELDETERGAGEALFEELLGSSSGPAWILHLGSSGDSRSWPEERFASLAVLLADAGARVLLLSGPAERDSGARIARALASREDIAHMVGQRDLRGLAGLLSAAAARGTRVVACDSGPCHVAAACGAAVDLLSGPQDPRKTGPWPMPETPGSPHRVIRSRESDLSAMAELTVEAVARVLLADRD